MGTIIRCIQLIKVILLIEYLHRMDVEILRDLMDWLDALERFERYAGLEFWFVSSSFCFHLVCVRFGLQPAPDHHNHSLAPGPNFGAQLRILFCLAGMLAIWEVISDLVHSHLNLNFAVFLLPVGIGLLRGKPRSQWWARFWFILGYILCALLVVMVLVSPGNLACHPFAFNRDLSRVVVYGYLRRITIRRPLWKRTRHQPETWRKVRESSIAHLRSYSPTAALLHSQD